MVFYSNGFQLELIDSTQPDNQIVLPGDSLLPDMVIYYCNCFCVLGAGAEDLLSILSIFPKQKFLILSWGKWGKSWKVEPNRDECPGGDLPTGILSQELNHYGSVCVLWIVHRKVKNEVFYVIKNSILLIAIARMGHTVLWVWARSWAVKFFVEGD